MLKFASILCLFVFASATTEFGQFLKLPFLIEHFYSHQQKQKMSLFEFLSQHYSKDHEDEDKKDDMRLPFKTMINGLSIVVCFAIDRIEIKKPEQQQGKRIIPLNTSFIPSQFIFQIFHPPRTV